MADCNCGRRGGKGKGVPGGMIKLTNFVIVYVPFPRRLFPVTVPDASGRLGARAAVRYLYQGQWLDADSLLSVWQPWREVVIAPQLRATA